MFQLIKFFVNSAFIIQSHYFCLVYRPNILVFISCLFFYNTKIMFSWVVVGGNLKPNIMLNLDIFLRTRLVYVCNDLSFFMFFTVFGTIYNFGSLQCFSLYTNSSSLFVMLLYTHKNTSSMLYFVLFLYDIYIIEK